MVFAALVGASVGAAAWASIRLVENERDRARHGSIKDAMGAPTPAIAATGGVATLEGTVAREAPTIVSFHPRGTSFLDDLNPYARTWRSSDRPVVIELAGGGRAVLDGECQVVGGSVESQHGARIEDAPRFGATEIAADGLRHRTGQFRRLEPGDRVRLRGAVAVAPDDQAAHYRGRSEVVRVLPPPGAVTPSVALVSTETPLRKRTRPALGALAVAALAFAVATGGTAVATRSAPTLAAPSVASQTASADTCRATVTAAIARGALTAAVESGEACGDPRAIAEARFARGDFVEASDAFAKAVELEPELSPSLSETEAHLFAERIERASASAHRMVKRFYPGPSTAEKRYLECIAAMIDGHYERPPHTGTTCAVAPSEYATTAQVLRGLDNHRYHLGLDGYEGAYEPIRNPFVAYVGARGRLLARPVGAEQAIVDGLPLAPDPKPVPPGMAAVPEGTGIAGWGAIGQHWWTQAGDVYLVTAAYASEVALFYTWAGLPERAARYWPVLDRVATAYEAKPPKVFHERFTDPGWGDLDWRMSRDEAAFVSHLMSVAAAAALYANDTVRFARYAAQGEAHSVGVLHQVDRMLKGAPWEAPREEGHWADRMRLFDAMEKGAPAVVAELVRQGSTGAEVLPRILPRVPGGEAAFVAWFEAGFPEPCLTCGASSYFGHLVDRRRVARLLGETEQADALAVVVERFADAQTNPNIAWELLELETFFARPR